MNGNNDFLGNELRRAADRMPTAALSFDDVKRRATSHQRRSIAMATAAAVIVIAAPITAITVLNGGDSPPIAGTPTATASPTPVGEVILDFAGAPLDTAPKVPIFFKGLLAETPIDLEQGYRLQTFAPFGDGWIAIVSDNEGNIETARYDSAGSTIESFPSTSFDLARGADGSLAFLNAEGDLELVDAAGGTVDVWDLTGQKDVQPIGVTADGSVVAREGIRTLRVLLARPGGELETVDGLMTVRGVNGEAIAGMVSYDDYGSCSAIFTAGSGAERWNTCEYTLDQFNGAGSLIMGRPANLDGIGDNSVSILDAATGETLVDFRFDNRPNGPWGFINQSVWEDDTHVLTQAWSSELGWRVLRLGVDGSVTVADLGDLGRNEMNAPVRFIAQP